MTTKFLVLAFVGTIVAGCNWISPPPGSEIEVLSADQEEIRVWGRARTANPFKPLELPWARYKTMEGIAVTHCEQYDKLPIRESLIWTAGARIAKFRCITPAGITGMPAPHRSGRYG